MEKQNLLAKGITKKYKKTEVLHPTDLNIEQGKIYGLLGRNGAGKTTLLSILSGQNPASSGLVTYQGERVWENRNALREIYFSRELQTSLLMGPNTYKIKDYLECAKYYLPYWDNAYAKRLIESFDLNIKKKINKLSKGMLSMVTITLALASRAPITMLDEPAAGLDMAARSQLYRLLLDDYEKTERTFIVSTHIVEEAASIFEEIMLMHQGNLVEKKNTDEFLGDFHYISGHEDCISENVKKLEIIHTENLGRQQTVCVRCAIDELPDHKDLNIAPAPLHKVFVYITGGEREENLA